MQTATPTPTPTPDADAAGAAPAAAPAAASGAGADRVAGDALAEFRPAGWTAVPRAVWPLVAGVIIAFLIHALLRPALGGFGVVLAIAGINIILAVSLNVVNGYAGQFSIGHAGFMAVGAYAGAAIVYYASFKIWGDGGFHGGSLSYIGRDEPDFWPPVRSGEWLFLAACLAAGLLAAAAGWIVGLPSLRLRGDYLAIVTLGFGEIVRVVLQGTDAQLPGRRTADVQIIRNTPFWRLADNLGGSRSFSSVPPYATVFWIFVWVAIVLAVAVRLKYSGYGRALLSIREDEIAARAVGVNVTRYKVRAFVLSAFFAGVAGALTALHVGQINAGELGFQRSFEIVIMVVLGGLGSVSGAAMAAVLLTVLPELLRSPPSLWPWGVPVVLVVAALIWFRARRRVRGLVALASVCAAYELVRFGAAALGVDLAQYRMIFYSLVLIFVMILRPQGLLGVSELWDLWPLNLLPGLRRSRLVSAAVGAGEPQDFARGGPPVSTTAAANNSRAAAPAPGALLEVGGVGISFGGLKAVQDFSLSLPPGALHGVIGPNGAGKTTVFNLLTGVYCPDAGRVVVDHQDVTRRKPHEIAAAGLARTFQNIRLFGELSVLDNTRMGAQMRQPRRMLTTLLRTPRHVAAERLIDRRSLELLDMFGLTPRRFEQAKNLPYGDQRRLEIARALATGPKVLLLDEPAAGMNPQEKVDLMGLIRFIRDRFGVGILLIEHDMKLVMSVCERITVLDHGETIAVGTPQEVQCNPAVIEAYLGEPVQ